MFYHAHSFIAEACSCGNSNWSGNEYCILPGRIGDGSNIKYFVRIKEVAITIPVNENRNIIRIISIRITCHFHRVCISRHYHAIDIGKVFIIWRSI